VEVAVIARRECEVAISVIIPTYRRRPSLERALRALAPQTLPAHTYEVLVVIDGSEDSTRELVTQLPTPYRLRWLDRPHRGRAAARNAGIAAAEGRLLVFLDDDMEPSPEFLEEHLRAHAWSSRLAVVGAVPIPPGRSPAPVADYIAAKFKRHLETLAVPGHQFGVRDFYGGNFSIERELLAQIGGFDEDFTLYGNEDLELSLRLRQAGVQLVFRPEAWARQHYSKSFAQLAQDNLDKGRTAVLLVAKHPAVLADLKLSTYAQAPRKWRAFRATLLLLTRICPPIQQWVVRFGEFLERHDPTRLHRYLPLVLDYCFWVGAVGPSPRKGFCADPDSRPFHRQS
jgi:GT2 family glycosyltransferase